MGELQTWAVASLSLPGGQDKSISSIFPHFPVFPLIFLNFPSFSSSIRPSGWATRPRGKAMATPLLQTLNKEMGKLWGAKWNDLMRKTGNWAPAWWRNRTLIWGALWWHNEQIRDPLDDEIARGWNWGPLMIWWGNLGPRPLILFKRFNTAPLHSFKLMGPK